MKTATGTSADLSAPTTGVPGTYAAKQITRRPVYLNPLAVRLPVTATVSLAHRVSGLLLLLCLPLLAAGLSQSLADEAGAAALLDRLHSLPGRTVLVVLTWAATHHTAAGVRHLLFDAGIGTTYLDARKSAWAVHAIALLVTLLALAAALGVFTGAAP